MPDEKDASRDALTDMFRRLFGATDLWSVSALVHKGMSHGYTLQDIQATLSVLTVLGDLTPRGDQYYVASKSLQLRFDPDPRDLNKLRKEHEERGREVESLKEALQTVKKEHLAAAEARDAYAREAGRFKAEFERSAGERLLFLEARDTARLACKQFRVENERLRKELAETEESLKAESTRRSFDKDALRDRQKKCGELESVNILLRDELSRAREFLHAETESCRVLQGLVAEKEKECDALGKENGRLSDELSKAVRAADSLHELHRLTLTAGEQLKEKLDAAEKLRTDLLSQADQVHADLSYTQRKLKDAEDRVAELEKVVDDADSALRNSDEKAREWMLRAVKAERLLVDFKAAATAVAKHPF